MQRRASTARALVWIAFACQAAFVAAWIVAGALEPGYSHVEQYVSELAARNAAHPWIVTAGIAAMGLSWILLGVALRLVLPRRRASIVAAALVALAGGVFLLAVFPLDCTTTVDAHCRALQSSGDLSWQHYTHQWASFGFELLLLTTPFALAAALPRGTLSAAALGAGSTGVGIFAVVLLAAGSAGSADGLVQRIGLLVVHAWALTLGVGVLWAARRQPRTGKLIPLRPRDFFARTWTGEGELVLRPLVVGRLFAQRFEARREAKWISDRVWRFEDEARFGDGHVEQRSTYCEFVGEDRVRLTAGDLPDGAEVRLEEGGFRIHDFRVAYPIGPVPALVRCRDRSSVAPDGTFTNVIDVRALGIPIPLARVTVRVRAEDPGA